MAKEKSLVEEAIIQMKNLEEAVAENAKGILASTMKQEIKELVKESLTEQEEDDEIGNPEIDIELPDTDDEESDDEEGDEMDMDNLDMDDEDDEDDDFDDSEEDDDDEDTIDLTDVDDDEEVLRVFQLMGPDDSVVVTKDEEGNINVKDSETGKEYMIVGEGEEEYSFDNDADNSELEEDYNEDYNDDEDSIEKIVERMFGGDDEFSSDNDEDEDDEDSFYGGDDDHEMVYEIEMGEEEENEELEEDMDEDDSVMESKMSIKSKGVGFGNPNKKKLYSNKPNQEGGFKTKMKEGPKSVGTGKAKFEYKDGENLKGEFKAVKKTETKEGSKPVVKKAETKEGVRTLGAGSRAGRKGGLPKPRAGSSFNSALKESKESTELQILREKNEEYRKALNVFRNKLNEVAVFNSNLAYATRLFTEHSTSKQEKINILRRFDSVETIKESKNLYQVLKDSFSEKTSQPVNESIGSKIEKTPLNGSSVNLIESKTYENPQFLRMKDLMAKIK